eukprot:CAMPEP_0173426964 /NCGR_PEP_ID=MMETSP1357-20121228/6285_1 /TAXON_ID=77926 /ORGANISM="Hemiselmis rufescens, Strain PCC563" /LENGTH=84 /DNA_ID=CAMNT_0014390707 /DNA_START=32 /DNA_END=282 /DNA_ORIENTATION=-
MASEGDAHPRFIRVKSIRVKGVFPQHSFNKVKAQALSYQVADKTLQCAFAADFAVARVARSSDVRNCIMPSYKTRTMTKHQNKT